MGRIFTVIVLLSAIILVIRGSEEKNSTGLEHAKTKRHLLLRNLLYAPKYPLRHKHQAEHPTKGQQILTSVRDDLVLLHRSLDWIARVTEFLKRRLPYPYINSNDFSFLSYYAPELYLDVPNYNHGPKPRVHITLKEEPIHSGGHYPHQGPREDFIVAASDPKPAYVLPEKEYKNEFRKFIPLTQPGSAREEGEPSLSSKDADRKPEEETEEEEEEKLSTRFNNSYKVYAPQNETLVGYYLSKRSVNDTRYADPDICRGCRVLAEIRRAQFESLLNNVETDEPKQPIPSDLYRLPSRLRNERSWSKMSLDQQGLQSTHKAKFRFPVKLPGVPSHSYEPVDAEKLFEYIRENGVGKDGKGKRPFNVLPYFDIHTRFLDSSPFPTLDGPIVVPEEEDFDWDEHRSLKKDDSTDDFREYAHIGHLPLQRHAIFDKNKLALYNSYGQFV